MINKAEKDKNPSNLSHERRLLTKIKDWANIEQADTIELKLGKNTWLINYRQKGRLVSQLSLSQENGNNLKILLKKPMSGWIFKKIGNNFVLKNVSRGTFKDINNWFIHPLNQQALNKSKHHAEQPKGLWLISGADKEQAGYLAEMIFRQFNLDKHYAVSIGQKLGIGFDYTELPSTAEQRQYYYRQLKQNRPDLLYFAHEDLNSGVELLSGADSSLIIVFVNKPNILSAVSHFGKTVGWNSQAIKQLKKAIQINHSPTNCQYCKQAMRPDPGLRRQLSEQLGLAEQILDQINFYQSEGCEHCQYSGQGETLPIISLADFSEVLETLTPANLREIMNNLSTATSAETVLAAAATGHLSPEQLAKLLKEI
ncbi:hypothetical protein COT94_03865 [Candidatus Falkowbacteria bacterium CG10_big_fil_rev_8_21_14_0_10_37_14]|uniref:Bacterial type II secretion system protein E domain-containing protein n=1 Tax=Candidatus Falkowbacteria bacterium CG10_big_fil_rev_8_21_14_0_10_37_14 TaxID=1974561 RepID=A0A2M6WSB2_9BACT|nr:hypothetical protein [Candidatus Falkowbacteria bacterium]PIT95698.1 MAG: hypothetical protein COT94_03865 [Candidatus Falkowbacteria bacterium CG10_big_fil_rev_8_21_14_0_10_37_14]